MIPPNSKYNKKKGNFVSPEKLEKFFATEYKNINNKIGKSKNKNEFIIVIFKLAIKKIKLIKR